MGSVSASKLRVKFNRHLAFMWSVTQTKETDEESPTSTDSRINNLSVDPGRCLNVN